jgi:hypothetical protein
MQLDSPVDQAVSSPLIDLPTPEVVGEGCPKRARWQIDLILLTIEALDLAGSEDLLTAAQVLNLQPVVKNRVFLWRLRCTNPYRRFSQRRPLELEEAKALVAIASFLARRQTVSIRNLLISYQQVTSQQVAPSEDLPVFQYLERFRRHFRSRMNLKRSGMAQYVTDQPLNELALHLLSQLLFCTGTAGMQRFWTSLFDGEVA